jgi:hypothetical protein
MDEECDISPAGESSQNAIPQSLESYALGDFERRSGGLP